MKKLNQKFVVGISSLLLLLLAACNKPNEDAGPAAPAITVGAQIDDAVITAKSVSALVASDAVKGYDIKVTSRKGEVMLSGFVDNQTQIDQSITIVKAIEGVKSVDSQLAVKVSPSSIGNKIDDGIITAKVKSSLLNDPAVKSLDIKVVTSKGEVQLSGFVDSDIQILRATEVAKSVENVKSVSNQMSVKK